MTLTEFLLARIAEDESSSLFRGYSEALQSRLRAECEAKRKIVERYAEVPDPRRERSHGVEARTLGTALRCIALPYADHPDYREEWKP